MPPPLAKRNSLIENTDNRDTGGVYAAALTPLDKGFMPDVGTYSDHCRWLLGNGCHGIAVLGTTGEANSLGYAARVRIIEAACRTLPADKLIIGTGSCALADSLALTRLGLDNGARRFLILPPFYYKPVPDDGVFRFFAHLIEGLGSDALRIYLYNFPQMTGYNFPLSVIRRLKKHFGPLIAGIKDSSGNWENMALLCREVDDFTVFAGTETYLLDILRAGGQGCISASANVTSAICRQVFDDPDHGDETQARLSAIRRVLEARPPVPALKALTGARTGNSVWDNVLPPFSRLPAGDLATLSAELDEQGFDRARCRLING